MVSSAKQLKEYLAQDKNIAGVSGGWLYDIIYPNYILSYIRLLRKYSFYRYSGNLFQQLLSRIILIRLHRLAFKLGFYIPKDVFGPGLYIPHSGSVVVNPNALIGANCQINNNVVIGQVRGKCPTIGDNCFIGSGAVICGDIKIGDNCWIGANSVVTHSFEENNVLIAGNPARIIKKRDNNWLVEFGKN